MKNLREDFFPFYSNDLSEKLKRVKYVIENLVSYNINFISDITEEDYHIIKLAVINSIKGSVIAYEETSRQQFVEDLFLQPAKKTRILDYVNQSKTEKCDFLGKFSNNVKFGIEVKGGEGNSVTLLERPSEVDIFTVWSHLDVMSNTPYENMRGVLGRIVKQMVNRDDRKQHVTYLIFYDEWYRNGLKKFKNGNPYPDVFVFPNSIPTISNLNPEIFDFKNDIFLKTLYKILSGNDNINNPLIKKHIWLCEIKLFQKYDKWKRRLIVRNYYDSNILFFKRGYSDTEIKIIKS